MQCEAAMLATTNPFPQFFDADGNGAGAAVQFATLAGALALAASDFTVI